jgi:hypothetical protein
VEVNLSLEILGILYMLIFHFYNFLNYICIYIFKVVFEK